MIKIADNKKIKASPAKADVQPSKVQGTPLIANYDIIPTDTRQAEISETEINGDKVQYSSRDSEGNTLSEVQQEYFKDRKVRDENGNLHVVYHGMQEYTTM